jgi:hypothetical protein
MNCLSLAIGAQGEVISTHVCRHLHMIDNETGAK